MASNELKVFLALLAAALALRLATFAAYGFFVDDAYIFMRYAENFAEGHGLVYNPGERVLGFTSPFYALLLGVARWVLSFFDFTAVVLALNLAFFAAFAWAVVRLSEEGGGWKWVAPVVLLFYFPYLDSGVSGMETPLLTALLAFQLLALKRERFEAALVLGAVAATVRPEGFLLLAAIGVYAVLVRKRFFGWASLAGAAGVLALWAGPTYWYYGTILPHSMLAKSSITAAGQWGGDSLGLFPRYLLLMAGLSDRVYQGLPQTGALVVGIIAALALALVLWESAKLFRERSYLLVAPLFFFLCLGFYHVGNPVRMFSWYAIPPSMAFALTALSGARRLVPALGGGKLGVAALSCAVLACLASFAGMPRRIAGLESSLAQYQGLARYIQSEAPGADSLMVSQIGYLGYATDLRIVDLAGLVSPRVFESRTPGEAPHLIDLIRAEMPSVLCFQDDFLGDDVIRDGLIRHRTMRSGEERRWFLENYSRAVEAERFYPQVFVRNALPGRPGHGNLTQGGRDGREPGIEP